MIKPNSIEERAYQMNIARSCVERSTLVVLPTGMGKTVIALLLIAELLQKSSGKILFMAPTKPLVEQHAAFLEKFLLAEKPVVFTGEVLPTKREELWKRNRIIVSTPQVIANDLISAKLSLKDVSLIIFDEAHRAVGDYAYVFVAKKYNQFEGLALGITASPGSDIETILEVCKNLNIAGVEIRAEYDPDVVPYIHDIYVKWVRVDVPSEVLDLTKLLRASLEEQIKELRKCGFLTAKKPVTTKDLLEVGRIIQMKLHSGIKHSSYFYAASVQAIALKINHALELAETQGITTLKNYFERLETEANSRSGSRAAKSLMKDSRIRDAMRIAKSIGFEHPKLPKVVEIVKEQFAQKPDSRIIVFTHYRETCDLVTNTLSNVSGVKAVRFVGQAAHGEEKGLKQKEQVELIQKFRTGECNVLVATSVGEEGLDIPSTDLVVFYEPVPSEIRTIQRRGRTGRTQIGKVVILITTHTKDEAYYWSSRKKEQKMRKELEYLRERLKEKELIKETEPESKEVSSEIFLLPEITKPEKKEKLPVEKSVTLVKGQKSLLDFKEEEHKLTLIADTREFNSEVVRTLARLELIIEPKQLDVGDYILSDRVGVERKEVDDFLQSLMDKRLFRQLKDLRNSYLKPILIIEGEGLFSRRQIGESAIYGALASIISDFEVPVIFTNNAKETADLLVAIAKREAVEKRIVGIRGEKVPMSTSERQQFIIEGLPNISGTLAQRLLSHFGNVKAIMNATVEELCEVKGIGKHTAEEIVKIVKSAYYKADNNI